MPIACEDLAQYGVILIPPSAPEYSSLVTEILTRSRSRPNGGPPVKQESLLRDLGRDSDEAAVLVNRASQAIVSLAYIWDVRLPDRRGGPVVTQSIWTPGTNVSVLLPFELPQRSKGFHRYWNTIFPGSKRLICFDGPILGDNTDVRPPEPDELSHGCFIGFRAGPGSREERFEPIKLTLDGIFLEDGGFAGPDRVGSWHQIVSAAETCVELAALAQEARHTGMRPEDFFSEVRVRTGQSESGRRPPPPPPGLSIDPEMLRKREREMIGWRILEMRTGMGDEAAIERIAGWSQKPVPKFHKL